MYNQEVFEYTKHAQLKFRRKRIRELKITKETVENIFKNPDVVDSERYPQIAVGAISASLSLLVVYKLTEKGYKVITFFPATKGRYESKILQRG